MKNDRKRLSRSALLLSAIVASRLGAQDAPRGSFGDLQVQSSPQSTEIMLEVPFSITEEDRTKKRSGLSATGARANVTAPGEQAPEAAPPSDGALPAETPALAAPSGEGGEAAVMPTPALRALRPGALTVSEIHLFFPGTTLDRSRLITVDDRIIQEVRLFADQGAVSMRVVVRRPVYYIVSREGDVLRIHVEPGTLLLDETSGAGGKPQTLGSTPKRRRPSDRRDGSLGAGADLQAEQLMPKVTMQPMRAGEGLTVDAEQLSADQEKNEIVAKGNVTIARAGTLLTADEVRINRDSQRAEASGNVQFTDPQGTIQADRFVGNLEDETGELTNGNLYLSTNRLTISGSKMQKSYGQTYRIENGQFTTCQCGTGAPSWSISGKSIDITLDGYGLVEDAKFKVLDVPVFYAPYLAFPAKRTRQSGLLAPLFGYSKKRGFTYTQPIYLVVNKSVDFTISPDIETSARVGGIGEGRWALDKKSKGVLNVSFFNEALRNNAERDIVNENVADPEIPEDRWSVTADVRHELPFGVRAFADALAVSDDFFLREIPTFSFDPEHARIRRTSRFSSSNGGFYRSWEDATLIGKAVYYQDFIQEDDLTLQRLPQVQFFGSKRLFDRHLKLGMNAEFVNFARDKGFDGPRVDIAPTATVPFRYQEYFNGNVALQLRETAYHLTDTEFLVPVSQAGGVQDVDTQTELDKSPTREILQAKASLGTEISRVFEIGGEEVKKLKHTIEPEIDYLFVPDVNQEDLPAYDFVDRINRRNMLTYGVTTRLLAKLDHAPPIDLRDRFTAGELNSFGGVTPSPFDDESTRGGVDALGDPTIAGPTPDGIGLTLDESARLGQLAEPAETGVDTGEKAALTPAERAARIQEEKSALSHIVQWAKLQISQSYDLRDSLQDEDENDHFSDVDIDMRLTPVPSFSLLFESTVNATEQDLTSARVGAMLRDPRERSPEGFLTSAQRASIAVTYRLISDGVLEEVDGSLVIPLADTISTFYQTRYDALDGEFLEKTGGLRLTSQCKCWIADIAVSDRVNPAETEVRFQITLVGLGSIGRAR